MTVVIGLTGGIGCGKSTVSSYFESLGVPVCDADIIAHQITTPNSVAAKEIAKAFGSNLIDTDGNLDRPQLKAIVFSDPKKLQQLEAILHPLIREEINVWINAQYADYIILSIPLLFEKGWQNLVDRTAVVDIPIELQLLRASKRDKVEPEIVEAIIQKQITRAERLVLADDIIDNSKSIEVLYQQLDKLHAKYSSLVRS